MKFIVDAQLPYGLKILLTNIGLDAIHTDDLPNKERSTDNEIREISLMEERIVITKDADFMDSYFIHGVPKKLLIVTTGNIKNKDLYTLFNNNIDHLCQLLEQHNLLEINNIELIAHE